MDQTEYVAALKPVQNSELAGASTKSPTASAVADQSLSLLMDLAFSLLTRMDPAVFVIAPQLHAQAPQGIHMRRLYALVRWAQAPPLVISCRRMASLRETLLERNVPIGMIGAPLISPAWWNRGRPRGRRQLLVLNTVHAATGQRNER